MCDFFKIYNDQHKSDDYVSLKWTPDGWIDSYGKVYDRGGYGITGKVSGRFKGVSSEKDIDQLDRDIHNKWNEINDQQN